MAKKRELSFMSPIVDGWIRRIGEAAKAKSGFDTIARQCDQFFNADLGFMWKEDFQQKFMGGNVTPKFKVTIAKAFELVAVIGPTLYWRYPNRVVSNYEPLELFPELFGDPQDEQAMQLYQSAIAEQQQDEAVNNTRNSLMQRYLNYSQREQPGGLSLHSELAITEALVKGRGCLWCENYDFADSERTLTGCFYDSVENLFIDPDCEDPTLRDAKWIARKHVNPWWEVEDRFGMKRGTLRDRGTIESAESQATRASSHDSMYRKAGQTFDMVVWYEVWSKGGVGSRMKDVTSNLDEAFDDVVGDYAYICIAKGIEYPLNAPLKKLVTATDEEVKEMFAWPTPFYKDDKWPVAVLDFYRKPRSCWPLALLSTGLGELMFLNVMMSVLCDRAYSTSRNIMAYLRSAAEEVESQLKSGSHEVFIELNDTAHRSINEVIQFLQQQPINYDIFKMIEWASESFDKRTGLTALVYGLNPGGVQSRTATDIQAKQENLSVRPDYMSGKVEEWQSEAANLEKFAARWHVTGESVAPLMGRIGSQLWDSLITEQDPEIVVRDMTAMVEAGSVRRPNRQKELVNLQAVAGYVLPEMSKQADATGDTNPLNEFFRALGRSLDIDTRGWNFGERIPQQPEIPPEVQQQQEQAMQMQQAQMEMELQKQQLEMQKQQMELEGKSIDMQSKQMEAMGLSANMQADMAKRQMELEFAEAKNSQDLQFTASKRALEMEMDKAARAGDVGYSAASHRQDLSQDDERHEQELLQMSAKAKVQIDAARQMAKAREAAVRRSATQRRGNGKSN